MNGDLIANFICQPDWAKEYPDSWLAHYFEVCVKVRFGGD